MYLRRYGEVVCVRGSHVLGGGRGLRRVSRLPESGGRQEGVLGPRGGL